MDFNKDTTIGEILEKAPEKADIIIRNRYALFRMSCISNGNIRRSMWCSWHRC